MIVVEGPDGAGKSTLVSRLKEDLALEQIPRAVNSDAQYGAPLDRWVEETQARMAEGVICDRHQLISHLMYGPTMRRTLYGDFQNAQWLANQLERFWGSRPIVIVCLPPLETIKANLEVDEHKVAQADIDVFYWNYHAWWADNFYRNFIMIWDYTFMSYETLLGSCRGILMQKGIR